MESVKKNYKFLHPTHQPPIAVAVIFVTPFILGGIEGLKLHVVREQFDSLFSVGLRWDLAEDGIWLRWDLSEDGIWLGRWVGLLRVQDKKGDTCSNCLTLTLLIREKHPQETETTHISLGRGRGDGKKIKLMAQNCQFCNLSEVSFPIQRQEIIEQNLFGLEQNF